MQFVAILFASTAFAWFLGRRTGGWRDHARRGLAAAMIVAGLTHFARVEPFVQHLPDWVPAREALVYLTGAVEVALGVALMRSTRHRATVGRLLAAYLIAVFPANVYVAVADVDVTGQPGGLQAWLRLPLQVLFVAWALVSTTPSPARTDPPSICHTVRSHHVAQPVGRPACPGKGPGGSASGVRSVGNWRQRQRR